MPKEETKSLSAFKLPLWIIVAALVLVFLSTLTILTMTWLEITKTGNETTTKNPRVTSTTVVDTPYPTSVVLSGKVTVLSGYSWVVAEDWLSFDRVGDDLETGLDSFTFDLPQDYTLENSSPGTYDIKFSGNYVGAIAGIINNGGLECFAGKPEQFTAPSGGTGEVISREKFLLNNIDLYKLTHYSLFVDESEYSTYYDYCFNLSEDYSILFGVKDSEPENWDQFLNNITQGEFQSTVTNSEEPQDLL